jgi:hypothetical protein
VSATGQQAEPPIKHAVCPVCQRPYDVDRVCVACGAAFTLSLNQQVFFLKKGLQQPRRCERCRSERRRARASE